MGKPNLTKTCTSCGLQKPLSSFLQLAGPEGATYGNICADCRRANIGKEQPKTEPDDFSRISSGVKIDSKAHVHGEIKKKEEHQREEQLEKDEHSKTEAKKDKRTKKIIEIEKEEREHRKSYLEKSSFLTTAQKTEAQQRALEAKLKTEQQSKWEAIKQEEKLKGIDLTSPYMPSQTGAQIKLQGRIFSDFKAWLGGSAPIVRSLDPSAQTPEQKKPKTGDALSRAKTKEAPQAGPEESVEKDIENTFKPFSRKK